MNIKRDVTNLSGNKNVKFQTEQNNSQEHESFVKVQKVAIERAGVNSHNVIQGSSHIIKKAKCINRFHI